MPKGTKKVEVDKAPQNESTLSFIKDAIITFVTDFFRNLVDEIKDDLQVRTEKLVLDTKKLMVFAFLVLTGIIFFLVGTANIIDFLTKIPGLGYLIIGAVLVAVGFLFNLANKNQE